MQSFNTCSVIATLSISQWTARRLDRGASDEVEANKNAKSKGAARVNKNLLAGRSELTEIAAIATRARNYLHDNTFGWGDNGRLLPVMRLKEVDRVINELRVEFQQKVAEFVAIYPSLITAQAMALGQLFRRDEYPTASEIIGKFHFSFDIDPVPSAGHFLIDTANEQLAELDARVNKANSAREKALMEDINKRLGEHLSRMADRLVSDTDAKTGDPKQRRFHDTLVTSAYDLCSLVKSLPALNGHEIAKATAALEQALGGTSAQTLRDDHIKRESVRKVVADLSSKFTF